MERDAAVDALLDSPVGAALFVAAAQQHLGVDELADPATVTALASIVAGGPLDPWGGELERTRRWVRAEAAPLRPLVAAVVDDPRARWWWAPLDRDRQLALTEPGATLVVTEPVGPAERWEVYAQRRAFGGLETATELPAPDLRAGEDPARVTPEVRSGLHAELAAGGSDWNPEYPLRETRLRVAADARVWEITSPADWHRLARTHGDPATYAGTDPHLLDSAGLEHGIGPTWSAVAADWDGVHLTFGGFLTSLYVPVTSGGSTTTLWSWRSERTLWLRDVLSARGDVAQRSRAPGRGHLQDLVAPAGTA